MTLALKRAFLSPGGAADGRHKVGHIEDVDVMVFEEKEPEDEVVASGVAL